VAQSVGGVFPTVAKLIELFTAMGCELHTLNRALEGPQGETDIRFLYNPDTDQFASLSGLDDDDRVPWSLVESWERNLGVEVPRPD
jgi:hypothetical protein